MLDGGILSGQPEGVPTHRVQHVIALETPVPCRDVTNGEGLGVSHVQITGGVGEHVQQVAAFPGPVVHDLERVVLLPVGGPLLLGRDGVVSPSRGLSRIAHNQYLQVTACPPAHTWPRLYRKGRHPVTCVYTGGQYPPPEARDRPHDPRPALARWASTHTFPAVVATTQAHVRGAATLIDSSAPSPSAITAGSRGMTSQVWGASNARYVASSAAMRDVPAGWLDGSAR